MSFLLIFYGAFFFFFFFQAEDGIRDLTVTGVQTCALPISRRPRQLPAERRPGVLRGEPAPEPRSEEHTSELQSQSNLVCRLLLEKKNMRTSMHSTPILRLILVFTSSLHESLQ